ncbi:TIGR00266 family protein [candidate division KSB1 bacterium]|nr:TIGR00266 family protein [candidate division KSB1 bacterium]NIR72327.1 TIGR00266 family protein [candidate division KSB1 bacterium]NIS26719.1 TIGR00266 family protein [candidate division KSB1 bacterium]NIT73465.1 TIGR00266 family protein [candidate division KSB1 bacterium]NIU27334.1 TIGR00266 family protein [candidate division KSB1 bacterium]
MVHEIEFELVGDDMQAVIIALDPGEMVQAEAGAMMYMTDGIKMNTGTGGGILKGMKRILTGESFFITTFQQAGAGLGKVAFAAPYPGKIIALDLAKMGTVLCQRDAYLCSAYGIDISVAFTKRLGAGFFGGEGFVLQRLSGTGLAFVHAGGTIIEKQLADGELFNVDTGCLVAFQDSIDYNIKFVGGIKTAFFGGEGLFFARLRGPGTVFLQTLPFSRLADRVVSAAMSNVGEVKRGGSVFGSLGNFIGGDR